MDEKVIYALIGIIGTLISILGFVIKNELQRIRDSIHALRNAVHLALLAMEILDERFKSKIKKDNREDQSDG